MSNRPTKAEIDEAMAIHCIDAKTRIFSSEFDALDSEVFDHVDAYRPSHIAVALKRGLTLNQTIAFINAENEAERAEAEASADM